MRSVLVILGLAVTACSNPVRQAEAFFQRGEQLPAFRVARTALDAPDVKPEDAKRLRTILFLSARAILGAPDTTVKEEAFELFEGLPTQTDEKSRAAQRLLRVMARAAEVKDLPPALAALEPEIADESDVRSNLRLIADQARGTAASVWAARTVVERWPDDADRWIDLALSQSAVRAFADAVTSLREAEKRLHESCEDLPRRVGQYDKVRRKSAYADLEVRRCQQGFATLAVRLLAALREQHPPADEGKSYVEARGAVASACPPTGKAAATDWKGARGLLLVSPAPVAAWLDGRALEGALAPLPAGKHRVAWKDGAGCHQQDLDVAEGASVALRTLPLDLPH